MEIPAKYNPSEKEARWYNYWLQHKLFRSVPDEREAFTNVIPPPNVTGVLHMGHMLNNTLQDVLVRRARMQGKNALWVPGTDHASIATEAKVVEKLRSQNIAKSDLSRDEFLKHAWEWKEKHGGIILEQLKRLGAACDWDRTHFTMDPVLSESVIQVFNDLYNKGYIYRGVRMVNWDPQAKTAVSDEEVDYHEIEGNLYYVRYQVVGTKDEWITIATTRPETILGDTAVCVNPADERYLPFHGKKVIVPLVNRTVPIICDTYVEMDFGTGCLKITPAHDINDYEIGIRHNLPSIDIFNPDGTLSPAAELWEGTDRFEARKLAVEKLKAEGNLLKIEPYLHKVGHSERTKAVIEPKLSMQWFLKMKELVPPALENVMNDTIRLHPAKLKNTYRHWMENVKDWCISRQLWWGHRIPAWYLPDSNEYVIAANADEALKLAIAKTGNNSLKVSDLRQDEDVLDTWFSSWLWPISVFDGIRNPNNPDFKYYYPTNVLITAPEILFFWVARMIMAGYEYAGDKPFSDVYLHGIVRDKQGRKMSKSLGNSPDPIGLIEQYGADGVRVGMMFCAAAGNDLLYDDALPEQGRNFGNKIWNAFRLIKGWNADNEIRQPEAVKQAVYWFENKLNLAIEQVEDHFNKFRISDALHAVYSLVWDEFASWYLELIKPAYQQPIDALTLKQTEEFFDKLLRLLHPFMPFITEDLWHLMAERKDGDSILKTSYPKPEPYDIQIIEKFEWTKEVITAVRKVRSDRKIPMKEPLELMVNSGDGIYDMVFDAALSKGAILSEISQSKEKPANAQSFLVKTNEYFIVLKEEINVEEELKKLNEELNYFRGFLISVSKKLDNERFVANAAPQVVELERTKKSDAEAKIKALEERIAGLQ
jgi:valyl-tRNA synthetase